MAFIEFVANPLEKQFRQTPELKGPRKIEDMHEKLNELVQEFHEKYPNEKLD
jgi:hypothetical protein